MNCEDILFIADWNIPNAQLHFKCNFIVCFSGKYDICVCSDMLFSSSHKPFELGSGVTIISWFGY
jgi:hypothetical protein